MWIPKGAVLIWGPALIRENTVRNLFRLEKETKAIKARILRDIKKIFEHKEGEENYYKPVRVSNF